MERSSTTLSLVALQILRRTTVIVFIFLCCDDRIIVSSQMPLLVALVAGFLALLVVQPGAHDLLASHQLGLEVQPGDVVCGQQSHLSRHDEKET